MFIFGSSEDLLGKSGGVVDAERPVGCRRWGNCVARMKNAALYCGRRLLVLLGDGRYKP